MEHFRVAATLKLRHGHLWDLLRRRGWNQSDLARHLGVSANDVSAWMRFQRRPTRPDILVQLMDLTGLSDEALFPDRLYGAKEKPQTEHTVVQDIPVARLLARGHRPLQVPSAEELWLVKDQQAAIAAVLKTLTPKEQFVVERRFGFADDAPWTLEQVGEHLGVSRERARDIEVQALRKLRHSITGKRPHALGR